MRNCVCLTLLLLLGVAYGTQCGVTLLAFSGTRDPFWTLTDDESAYVLAHAAQNGPKPRSTAALGYRGFAVSCAAVAQDFLVYNQPLVEDYLLKTAPEGLLPPALMTHIRNQKTAHTPNYGCRSVPGHPYIVGPDSVQPYEPKKWNDGGVVQENDNCYNYGTNIITETFAQPGCGTLHKWDENTCESVGAAAVRDGLVGPVTPTSDQPSNGHYIALVMWPGVNFHWYRKDDTGYWSHKPGSTEARDYDNNGNKIKDPATAARGSYSQFCYYYIAVPSKLKIA